LSGVLGQFAQPQELLNAAGETVRGPWRAEAFTPFHVEGLSEALGRGRAPLPAVVLAGGLLGGGGGFLMQYWASAAAYPLDVGGRPLNSWPAFIPVTFELTVLGASLAAVFGLIAFCGLPRLNHPVFEAEAFRRASSDKFFLYLEGADGFDAAAARARLRKAGAEEVYDVPAG
jgi:hypothetical protein